MAVGEDGPPDECAARTYVYTTGFSVYGLADAIGPIRHTYAPDRMAPLIAHPIDATTARRPRRAGGGAAAAPPLFSLYSCPLREARRRCIRV